MGRSPGSLLTALFATAIVVTLTLGWFGWKLVTQQSRIEQDHRRERLDDAADVIEKQVRGRVTETDERLRTWVDHPAAPLPAADVGVVVGSTPEDVRQNPPHSLPFVPFVPPARGTDPVFIELEAAEISSGPTAGLFDSYRKLTLHGDRYVRGGALLRLGILLRKSGDFRGAVEVYRKLESLGDLEIEGYPAELAGLDGQRRALGKAGDRAGEENVAGRIAQHLDSGRWLLSRGVADYSRDQVTREARPESWVLAEALERAWDDWGGHPPDRGLRIIEIAHRPVLVLARSDGRAFAVVVSFTAAFLKGAHGDAFAYQLRGPEGILAGTESPPPTRPVERVISSAHAPWTLQVWSAEGAVVRSTGVRTLVGMMGAVMIFLWGAVYFMTRAIRREASVGRLQSEFVAAVSHEFRSPLTTLRQLAEMLDLGAVRDEDRRRTYYRVLVSEARRLQRLVETLLDFGKMEAGAMRYRMEPLDVAALVRDVAAEMDAVAGTQGKQIEICGSDGTAMVLGDADAMALAVRNVIDNAVKYSPGSATVRVEVGATEGRVSIRVIDHGLGIDPSEQDAIFRRFVRGQSASAANVKGTGVGLAMVRYILGAHGGEIQLESQPGHGSTFTLLLPAAVS